MAKNVTEIFKDLFILDLANNHQGDLKHGIDIINSYSKVAKKEKIKAAIKFQFRQLDTFIHPNYQNFPKNKHFDRFIETKLSREKYQILFNLIKKNGLLTCCTPFDEESVEIINEMNFDIVKIASCSAKDWPLIEKVSTLDKPIVFSTGGLKIKDIDNLVSFFEHKGNDFCIMHCVSIYPTPKKELNLNLIKTLKQRYKNKVIGWSTHEDPNDFEIVKIAYSVGARVFEKHIGLEAKKYKNNKYSINLEQFENWIKSYKEAILINGNKSKEQISQDEISGINSLLRGVYVKQKSLAKTRLKKEDVFFSMPLNKNQISSGEFFDGIFLKKTLQAGDPITFFDFNKKPFNERSIIKESIHEIKAMLNLAKIYLDTSFEIEYSHHYGIKNFRKTGALIINCINRKYCKKLIVMLPNQKHPAHYHERKEETFQVLNGSLDVYLDGKHKFLREGETCLIQPGVWHSFESKDGCIFEEISTTHYNNDSFYKDKKINEMERKDRKTIVENWGRFEI